MLFMFLATGLVSAEPSSVVTDDIEAPLMVEYGVIPENVAQIAREVVNQPLAYRMKALSDPFLGLPYEIDGHGEGSGPDTDPPARYDTFDCLTFLEEILALAFAGDPVSAPVYRQALRYKDGEVDYTKRHHFMMAQWVPENIASGFVVDITHTLGETHRIEKTVTRQVWQNWAGTNGFQLRLDELPVGEYGLNVLSLDAAEAAIEQIPPGAIILTVRQPKSWKPIVVSHVGFIVPRPEGHPVKVRHASKIQGGAVRDHTLAWYIERMRWYKRAVEGIAVLMPVEQGPRSVTGRGSL